MSEDITERKRAAAALRESEERYRVVVEDQTEVISRVKADGTFSFVNEVFCRFFGRSAAELVDKKWQPVALPEDVSQVEEKLRAISPANPVVVIENRVLGGDGQVHWMEFVNRGFFGPQGQLTEFQSVGRDITARRQAEARLRESESRLHSLVACSMDAVLLTAPNGRIVTANEAACRMFGRSEQELTQGGRGMVVDAADPRVAAALEERARTGRFRGELTFLRREGTRFPGEVSSVVFTDEHGELRTSMVIRDITVRKRLEADRAEAVARLAVIQEEERNRISRDLHDQTAQHLVALAVELKNLETGLAAGQAQSERVRLLRQTVDDLQQQVRQIAWGLRAWELVRGDLEAVLREYLDEWSERVRVPVDCECRCQGGGRLPPAVETTLFRVIQQALANVQRHARARRVAVLLERDESMVRLTVEDDGCGLDPDAARKSPETSRRLGLLGMKERVLLVGGTLLVESQPGAGTTILIRIPIPTPPLPA